MDNSHETTDIGRSENHGSGEKRKHLVFTDIDLHKPGKQIGYLYVPHSPHEDAWGTVRIPIAVIKGAPGKTVLLEGGNHGDEYEGPITLMELIREIEPSNINGRLIIIPSINFPAVEAGRRTSPLDGLNFNRSFPGDPAGSMTQQIAAYVSDVLMPQADAFVSLHAGGSSLDIVAGAMIHAGLDPEHTERNRAAARAFGTPITIYLDLGDKRTAYGVAVALGITTVTIEMRGQGTVDREALALCRQGVRNLLAHFELTPAAHEDLPSRQDSYALAGNQSYVISGSDGIVEFYFQLGEAVDAGIAIGAIHPIHDPTSSPVPLIAKESGILYGKRHPGRVRPGNCCAVIAGKLSDN